ncbi:MAG TPA: hypothetical protein VFA87_08720, partial [Rhizomicrobium sp.]|nr:hypothetical protein [Rhizomicrobium sp.]
MAPLSAHALFLAAMMPWRFQQRGSRLHVFLPATITSTAGDRMSDMRNFNGNKEPTMSETISETNLGVQPKFRDTGGLSHFHHSAAIEEEGTSSTAKIAGAAVVAVLLCGAGAYAYMSMSSAPAPKPAVATTATTSKDMAANTPAPAPQSEAAATETTPAAPAAPPSTGKTASLAHSPYGAAPAGGVAVKGPRAVPVPEPAAAPEDTTIVKHRHHVRTARVEREKEVTENTREAAVTGQLNTQESATVTQENRAAIARGKAALAAEATTGGTAGTPTTSSTASATVVT